MRFTLPFVLVITVLLAACGGSDSPTADSTPAAADGSSLTSGSVAPNTFLTFENQRYKLVDLLQANLAVGPDFQKIGSTDKADIEFSGRLDIYRRSGDAGGVYTLSKGKGTGEQAVPDLWLHWVAAD